MQVATVSIVSAIAREAEVVFDHEAVFDNLIAIAAQVCGLQVLVKLSVTKHMCST
jgi:hypothetical protein